MTNAEHARGTEEQLSLCVIPKALQHRVVCMRTVLVFVENFGDGAGDAVPQRGVEDDQRLRRHGRVEAGVHAAVGVQPPPQVLPALDRLHRLIPVLRTRIL